MQKSISVTLKAGPRNVKTMKMKLTMVKVIVTGLDQRLVSVTVAFGAFVLLILILLTVQQGKERRSHLSIHGLVAACGTVTTFANFS